ncbi:glycoside hydrolase family 3 C-terminal domain-containing protein [Streptomyces sp. NPDC017448]|uniref:beta-glucosidase n=1 Tax=Streptomyces sp. NPDC017448 TaxID=3364996 RepID=UPI00378E3513
MNSESEHVLTARFRADANPWPTCEEDRREADALVARMTLEEKVSLLTAPMGYGPRPPRDAVGSAGHCGGLPRLGIPPWDESDASLGVTNPMSVRGDEAATAFPSSLALGATFDRELAAAQGRALGVESRAAGMSVQLAGGMNLIREPRGGRNFEYFSEDPLLSGILAGSSVRGVQEKGVVSTLKHFALNAQDTGRVMISSDLAEPELRASDLLAFQIAIEHGGPRSIMTGYNMVNRVYASENPWLLNTVLKGDWDFRGFVMSDWGGTHSSAHAATAGLDRQSGHQLDTDTFFGDGLIAAVRAGRVPEARIDDMAARIIGALRSVGALGARREPVALSQEVREQHAGIAGRVAVRSLVLLRNENGVLPLDSGLPRLVVVGGRADTGVLSGGGSSAVTPPDAEVEEGFTIAQMSMPKVLHRPAPLDEMRRAFPHTEVVFLEGGADEVAASLREDDTAVVFAGRWATEGRDNRDLRLDGDQDALISAVAAGARRTVVVLETPGAVTMPWLEDVEAVLAAWYGGGGGAAAIAAVLAGKANPSGRLPVTFPAQESQLPRRELPSFDATTSNPGEPLRGSFPLVSYDIEGADVGYRWYAREGLRPLFWFGSGLSYTEFEYSEVDIRVGPGGYPTVSFRLTNTGGRAGIDVPQVYLAPPDGVFRLVGWADVALDPGQRRTVRITADEARSYGRYVVDDPRWVVEAGTYRVRLARSAAPDDVVTEAAVDLEEIVLKP